MEIWHPSIQTLSQQSEHRIAKRIADRVLGFLCEPRCGDSAELMELPRSAAQGQDRGPGREHRSPVGRRWADVQTQKLLRLLGLSGLSFAFVSSGNVSN